MSREEGERERDSRPRWAAPIYQQELLQRGREALDHPPSEKPVESGFYYYEAKLAKWLPADREAAILDAGCGRGAFLGWLAAKGYRSLTGVDWSPIQVEAARKSVPTAEVWEADVIEFLASREKRYDLIAALDLIEHLTKERVLRFLELAFRALKPGGGLILQTPNAASPWGMSLRWGDFTHESCFTPRTLSQLLQLAGFTELEIQAAGPVAHGWKSAVRVILWRMISCYYYFIDLAETGQGGKVYTRVFQCFGRRPPERRE